MTDPDNFLSRWSRRKREAAKDEPERKAQPDADAAPKPAAGEDVDAVAQDKETSVAVEAGAEEPAFDLSKLPSIESITAETDIRPFLARGVPSALRQAALRRMWSADPAIRDFIEVAENQWDFNAPGEILGFDLAAPTGDLKRMVADILGDKPADESPPQSQASRADEAVADAAAHRSKVTQPSDDDQTDPNESLAAPQQDQESVRPTSAGPDVATQQNAALQEDERPAQRRSHGGALPR